MLIRRGKLGNTGFFTEFRISLLIASTILSTPIHNRGHPLLTALDRLHLYYQLTEQTEPFSESFLLNTNIMRCDSFLLLGLLTR